MSADAPSSASSSPRATGPSCLVSRSSPCWRKPGQTKSHRRQRRLCCCAVAGLREALGEAARLLGERFRVFHPRSQVDQPRPKLCTELGLIRRRGDTSPSWTTMISGWTKRICSASGLHRRACEPCTDCRSLHKQPGRLRCRRPPHRAALAGQAGGRALVEGSQTKRHGLH